MRTMAPAACEQALHPSRPFRRPATSVGYACWLIKLTLFHYRFQGIYISNDLKKPYGWEILEPT